MTSGVYVRTEETRRKMSKAFKGRIVSKETKKKISESHKKWHKEVGFSDETKRKIGLAHKGRKLTEEHRKKLSLSHKGNRLTEKTKRKIGFGHKREKSSSWKGGKFMRRGYILIIKPDHPKSTKQGYILEHRLVMEKKLGRYLKPEEVVHHLDLNKQNNHSDNLHLFGGQGKHKKYHFFLRSCVWDCLKERIVQLKI